MSRKSKSLKLLPQLIVDRIRIDKSMIIEENREEWRKQRSINLKVKRK